VASSRPRQIDFEKVPPKLLLLSLLFVVVLTFLSPVSRAVVSVHYSMMTTNG